MKTETLILNILLIVVMYLNIVATYHLWSVDTLSRKQKLYQGLFAWLVPLFGAIFVSSIHLSEKEYIKEQKSRKGLAPRLINVLTFVAFTGGYGGSIEGMSDGGSDGSGGFGSGDGGGGGGDS